MNHQIDGIRIFEEGDQTVVKIPTVELERVSKSMKNINSTDKKSPSPEPISTVASPPINAKSRIYAPAIGASTAKGGKRKLNRRKTNKKKNNS